MGPFDAILVKRTEGKYEVSKHIQVHQSGLTLDESSILTHSEENLTSVGVK